jgi:predicted AlkP superfamily phosphohydrolase/phosphomutase
VRAIIFGVDGLTFRILDPLIERGLLPNFQKLREQGCTAILESKYPPLTPPAWTSLSTGLKPARHGVYDYWMYASEAEGGSARSIHVQTQRRGGKAIWNILSEYGKQVLVVNVPTTYPPEAVNGIMISGYTTPSADVKFTYPASFKEELFRVVPDYQIDLEVAYRERLNIAGKVGPLTDAVLHMTGERIKLILYLLKEKPWDFCYMAFIGTDRLQHPLWEEIMAQHPRTTAYYQMLDDALGQILALLEPEDSLFVVSDHGFCGHHTYFDINEYLYGNCLLTFADSSIEWRRKQTNRSVRLRKLASRLGVRSVGRKIKRKLKAAALWPSPDFSATGLERPLLEHVDWEKTLAYAPSLSGMPGGYADIFLNPTITQEEIDALRADLLRQKHPATGQPLVEAIYTNEAYGSGPYMLPEPHLLVLPKEGITFRFELGNQALWEDLGKSFGSHHKDGVLCAYGGPFKRGFRGANAEIYDLVPTLLQAMSLPLPYAFDGKALQELFVEPRQAETPAVPAGSSRLSKLQKLLEV